MSDDPAGGTRARFLRVQELFHAAAEISPDERRAWLEAHARGADGAHDPSLVDDVLSLLEADALGGTVLDRDLSDVAVRALAAERAADPPRALGPYRVLELLGEGGMGVVYLAERPDLETTVAIKILRDAWLSPSRRVRFASEQRTLAQLNHPNIARIYDADTLPDGTPWFAMEYVDGVPLAEACRALGPAVRDRLRLFRAVCEAVQHAHEHAVIHRDLKPSNILVTRGGQPKLLDFGIAKRIEGLDPRADWTRAELRLMTPAYAAPEQVRGEAQGAGTDVYALGAILYELLTGRPPIDVAGKTAAEAAHAVAEVAPERPSVAARAGADAGAVVASRTEWSDLDVVCLTALQKEPARRYRSVESLMRDVDHFLRGEPLEARPDTPGYRVGKFVRRNWRTLSVAAAVVLAVGAIVTFYTASLSRAKNVAVSETGRARRIQEFMNGLFTGGDPDAGPSESLRVVTLLDRGVRDAHELNGEPAMQAELYRTLGGIYQQLGDLDRADSLLQEALVVQRTQAMDDRAGLARSQIALGLLRSDQSRFDQGEALVRQGLGVLRGLEPRDRVAEARALTSLGLVLENKGDYDESIAVLHEAARLDSLAHAPANDAIATLTELANSHFYAGHYEISDSLNRHVLGLDRARFGPSHPSVAADLVNLGSIQQEWGRWAAAESCFRQALGIYRGWYGENHYETAATLTMVGRALVQLDRADEAREPLAQALAIRERIYGLNHPKVAATLNEIGLLAQNEQRYDDAIAAFTKMVDIDRVAYGGKHYQIGLALSNLGGAYAAKKDYAHAEQAYRQALEMYERTLPPDHLYFGITRLKLGRSLLRSGRFAEAEKATRAGYENLTHQSEPQDQWIGPAKTDLVAEYEALGRPEEAAKFRTSP